MPNVSYSHGLGVPVAGVRLNLPTDDDVAMTVAMMMYSVSMTMMCNYGDGAEAE